MRSAIAGVTSVGAATYTIREVLETGSLLVSVCGGLLALVAGYYALRIQKRKWDQMNGR